MSNSINTWGGTTSTAGDEPLFVVRRPWHQTIVFVVLGSGALVLGIGGLLVQILVSHEDTPVWGFFLGGGALFLLFGLALRAGRITVHDRYYVVKNGFGRGRRREVDDVHLLRYGSQSNGGPTFISLTGWNERRKKQFMVFTSYRGYQEFTAWLAQRRPEEWADCERAGLPD